MKVILSHYFSPFWKKGAPEASIGPPPADSLSLKCTALRHEASDYLRLRSFSLQMKASDSCKIQAQIFF
jgi:hypothetical protein